MSNYTDAIRHMVSTTSPLIFQKEENGKYSLDVLGFDADEKFPPLFKFVRICSDSGCVLCNSIKTVCLENRNPFGNISDDPRSAEIMQALHEILDGGYGGYNVSGHFKAHYMRSDASRKNWISGCVMLDRNPMEYDMTFIDIEPDFVGLMVPID